MSKTRKPGRPSEEKPLTMEELLGADGKPRTVAEHKRDDDEFIKAVQGDTSAREYGMKKGMYAGMANPEDYLEMYKTISSKPRKGRPWTYPSREALQAEINSYFEFVIDRRIAVTVAGLASWLGITTSTLRLWKQQSSTMPFYEVIEPTIAFIHALTEQGAIDGNIPAIPFIFLAKNYHGLSDKVEYSLETAEKLTLEQQNEVIQQLPD